MLNIIINEKQRPEELEHQPLPQSAASGPSPQNRIVTHPNHTKKTFPPL